jgi:hypothetical protein
MGPLALWFVSRPTLTQIQPLDSTVHDAGSDADDVDAGGDTPSTYASDINGTTKICVCIPNFEIRGKFRQWLQNHIDQ